VTDLQEKIRNRKARAGVIGLGYVGLPLAVEFARAGLDVTGFDVDAGRVEDVNQGRSYIVDMSDREMREILSSGRLRATADFSALADMDTINICVPTPLRKTKDPDLTYIVSAVRSIRDHLRRGQLVVLESTTYPGTTEEVVQPILEESGLRAGRDFYLAFSPERIDPGNPNFQTRNIPKVVGGHTPACSAAAQTLYEQCIETVVPVSSTRVAEMVKLLENTFRSVNIGLVNELAQMSHRLGIDVWEVIDAAKTKPFGFMPFYPGPGLGGHCIPVDPYYLSWKARMHDFEPRFIELAGIVNESMPRFVVERITEALNRRSKSVRDSKIHLIGLAYKRGVNDVRESPALNVMKILFEKGAVLSYSDPYVPRLREEGLELASIPVEAALSNGCDCAVILTDHTEFDYEYIARSARVVVDTRNALRSFDGENIVRL
jgi:UDP-N-acetyl-D-glucosamine dehydrogenase